MILRRWDIITLRIGATDKGHPAVVLSSEDILNDPEHFRFNVLTATTKLPAMRAGNHQVLLDEADGLDHLTLVDCSMVFVALKSSVIKTTGSVTIHRRQQIQRTVRGYLGLG